MQNKCSWYLSHGWFFANFFILRNTEISIESNYWLGMYVKMHFRKKCLKSVKSYERSRIYRDDIQKFVAPLKNLSYIIMENHVQVIASCIFVVWLLLVNFINEIVFRQRRWLARAVTAGSSRIPPTSFLVSSSLHRRSFGPLTALPPDTTTEAAAIPVQQRSRHHPLPPRSMLVRELPRATQAPSALRTLLFRRHRKLIHTHAYYYYTHTIVHLRYTCTRMSTTRVLYNPLSISFHLPAK